MVVRFEDGVDIEHARHTSSQAQTLDQCGDTCIRLDIEHLKVDLAHVLLDNGVYRSDAGVARRVGRCKGGQRVRHKRVVGGQERLAIMVGGYRLE